MICKFGVYYRNDQSVQLGGDKIYKSFCPFDWMENISIETKTNFFEARVAEYSLALATKVENKGDAFTFSNEF